MHVEMWNDSTTVIMIDSNPIFTLTQSLAKCEKFVNMQIFTTYKLPILDFNEIW